MLIFCHVGISNGLKLILDVETFDYAFTDRSGAGMRFALTDPRDQGLIHLDGSNVMPGLSYLTPGPDLIKIL